MNNDNNLIEGCADEIKRGRLLAEACELPLSPGVYIMKNISGKVIYVGKSRKLRDRVSQYFRNGEKNLKTRRMVASVDRFEYIVCDTEIEALTLENTLIKQYSPRYNIRLKDAKSYPYIKLTAEAFPRLVMSRKRENDGARYFGPYSGTSTVFSVMALVNKTFGLPSCKKRFPADIGKERPCLYYRIGQCCGVCTGSVDAERYGELISYAAEVLRGNTSAARRKLEARMYEYAEAEAFEAAARCRDTIKALEALSQKQKVVASPDCDEDVFGVYYDDALSVMSMLMIRGGALIDKVDFSIPGEAIVDPKSLCSLVCEYYHRCDSSPTRVLVGFDCDEEDITVMSDYLSDIVGGRVRVSVPKIGDNRKLCDMAADNAREAALRLRRDHDRNEDALIRLSALLGLEVIPERIEAYDISNLGDEHITAGMIVCENGSFKKRDYRSFKISSTAGADDYGALRETLRRRLAHLVSVGDDATESDALSVTPDLILLDGGAAHLGVALEVMDELGVRLPAVGMVKDDFHKTRALITAEGEVGIAKEREVYGLIYRIQEEVHRFTVSKMSAAKRKTYKTSTLEKIKGIGPAKSKLLLSALGGLGAVKTADRETLCAVKGISESEALAVYGYFHPNSAAGDEKPEQQINRGRTENDDEDNNRKRTGDEASDS